METVMSNENVAVPSPGSGDEPILMELSQLSPGLENLITRPSSYPTDDRKHFRLWLRIFGFPTS